MKHLSIYPSPVTGVWRNGFDTVAFLHEEKVVRDTGFEPVTPSVSGRCSTAELTARVLLSDREAGKVSKRVALTRIFPGSVRMNPIQPGRTGGIPAERKAIFSTIAKSALSD